jgi:GTPase SAR1 family protein
MVWGSAAAIGITTALWNKARLLLSRLMSFVFVTVTFESSAAQKVQSFCWATYRRSRFGSSRFNTALERVRKFSRYQWIGFEVIGNDPVVFWRGWRPLIVGKTPSNGGQNNRPDGSTEETLQATFIRGTWNAEKLLLDAITRANDQAWNQDEANRRRHFIMRCIGSGRSGAGSDLKSSTPSSYPAQQTDYKVGRLLGWNADDIGGTIEPKQSALSLMALPASVLPMIEEVKRWHQSEAWYRERNIPWTRGWLIYGAPGTGKTSLIRAIAQDLDLPIYVFDLATMTNRELVSFWKEAQAAAPLIVLLEDLDAIFRGRENRLGENGGGLTFDCLLNCLSGIESAQGIFKIATTNNIADLDPALGIPQCGGTTISTRPGRLDRAFELPVLDEGGRIKIATRILADCPEYISRIVKDGKGDSGAQFTERCSSLALAEMWNDKTMHLPSQSPDDFSVAEPQSIATA